MFWGCLNHFAQILAQKNFLEDAVASPDPTALARYYDTLSVYVFTCFNFCLNEIIL